MIKCIIVAIVLLLGIYFVTNPTGEKLIHNKTIEGFDNNDNEKVPYRCPNVLIQQGSEFILFNNRLTKVPGVNPIKFSSLDDYAIFVNWQKSQGIRCPVLYLQHTYDAQGNPVYKVRPSFTNLQGGLNDDVIGGNYTPIQTKLFDAGRDDPPYNENGYPAYDPLNQYIGLKTPLDKMFHDTENNISPNPMDSNWGGINFTQDLVGKGYYRPNYVFEYKDKLNT